MPIYDYTCARCGHLTEVIHGIHDGGPRFCPQCGTEGTMRKGFTAPAVHFKGSGWAKKDRSATASAGRSRAAKPTGDADSGSTTDGERTTGNEPAASGSSGAGTASTASGESPGGSSTAPTTAPARDGSE